MHKNERVDLLQKAQSEINSAIRNIRLAMEDTNDCEYIERYMIGHLDNWANSEGSFDTTIPKLIDKVEEGEYEDE